jgi:hypothetical protein
MSTTDQRRKLLDKCQDQLLELQIELIGYSALFKNMADCELTADELHGVGLSLEKMAKGISVNLHRLSLATSSKI